MNIFTAEQITIGYALRYGKLATAYLLPMLLPDRFIYNRDGEWGKDHAIIWQKIYDSVVKEHTDPSIATVGIYQDYLQGLVNDLQDQHGIYEFNSNTLLSFAEVVEQSGTLYKVSTVAKEYGQTITNQDVFNRKFATLSGVENYISTLVGKLSIYTPDKTGYKHASEVVPSVIDRWERQYSGEQTILLPVGWPCLEGAQLPPRGQLGILHGMSNMGKSALLLAMLVGTAIGLKVQGIQGCTALNALEMSSESLIARVASMLAGVDHTRLIGGKLPLTPDEFERLKDWARFVEHIPFYLDDTNLITSSFLDYLVTSLHNSDKGPVYMLGTDYTELFADENESKEQAVNNVVRNHMAIAHKLDTAVITISQSTYGANPHKYYIAGMSGLRWSRGATQAADWIVELLNYPEMHNKGMNFNVPDNMGIDDSAAWLLLQKNRYGQTGAVRLGWEANYTRFFDYEVMTANNGIVVMYDHLKECKKLADQYKTKVVALEDTPYGEWR